MVLVEKDLRDWRKGRRTVSNDSYVLALEIVAPVPACRVHDFAIEALPTLDIRVARLIQLSNCRNQKVTVNTVCWVELCILLSSDLDVHFPPILGVVPGGCFDGCVEAYVFVEAVLLRHTSQVVLEYF